MAEVSEERTRSLVNQAVVVGNGKARAIFVPALCRLYELAEAELPGLPASDSHTEISLERIPLLHDEVWSEVRARMAKNQLLRRHTPGIAIIVTQNCNLSCSYCLAKQGTFGLELSAANGAMVKQHIAQLFSTHPEIDFIKFFGGEPTLRMDLIEDICEYVYGELGRNVHFAVTTNGTLPAEDHLEVWRKYRVSVSVSIDGPASIHDSERVDKRGRGSHEKALRYAKTLEDAGFPFAVVGVFDGRHIAAGISYSDTIRYLNRISPLTKVQFLETLGAASSHDVTVGDESFVSNVTRQIEEAAAEMIRLSCSRWVSPGKDWFYDNNLMRFVQGVMSETAVPYEHACTASNLTTIFPGGELMPCYTFSEAPSLHLGRVTADIRDIENRRGAFRQAHTWNNLSSMGVRAPWYRGVVGDICVADMRNSARDGVLKQSRFYALFQEVAVGALLREIVGVSSNAIEMARLQHAINCHRKITGEFSRKSIPLDALQS